MPDEGLAEKGKLLNNENWLGFLLPTGFFFTFQLSANLPGKK